MADKPLRACIVSCLGGEEALGKKKRKSPSKGYVVDGKTYHSKYHYEMAKCMAEFKDSVSDNGKGSRERFNLCLAAYNKRKGEDEMAAENEARQKAKAAGEQAMTSPQPKPKKRKPKKKAPAPKITATGKEE